MSQFKNYMLLSLKASGAFVTKVLTDKNTVTNLGVFAIKMNTQRFQNQQPHVHPAGKALRILFNDLNTTVQTLTAFDLAELSEQDAKRMEDVLEFTSINTGIPVEDILNYTYEDGSIPTIYARTYLAWINWFNSSDNVIGQNIKLLIEMNKEVSDLATKAFNSFIEQSFLKDDYTLKGNKVFKNVKKPKLI